LFRNKNLFTEALRSYNKVWEEVLVRKKTSLLSDLQQEGLCTVFVHCFRSLPASQDQFKGVAYLFNNIKKYGFLSIYFL